MLEIRDFLDFYMGPKLWSIKQEFLGLRIIGFSPSRFGNEIQPKIPDLGIDYFFHLNVYQNANNSFYQTFLYIVMLYCITYRNIIANQSNNTLALIEYKHCTNFSTSIKSLKLLFLIRIGLWIRDSLNYVTFVLLYENPGKHFSNIK